MTLNNKNDFIKINNMELVFNNKFSKDDNCIFCKSKLSSNPNLSENIINIIITGQCDHTFHKYCFDNWTKTINSNVHICPIDKTSWKITRIINVSTGKEISLEINDKIFNITNDNIILDQGNLFNNDFSFTEIKANPFILIQPNDV